MGLFALGFVRGMAARLSRLGSLPGCLQWGALAFSGFSGAEAGCGAVRGSGNPATSLWPAPRPPRNR